MEKSKKSRVIVIIAIVVLILIIGGIFLINNINIPNINTDRVERKHQ